MSIHFISLASTGMESVPAATFKDVFLILLGLVGLALGAYGYIRKPVTTITPDPLRVEKLDKFATRDFCSTLHSELNRRLDGHDSDIKNLYDEFKSDREASAVSARQRSAAIYGRIDNLETKLTDKIDTMPDRIIKILSELNLLRRPNGKDHL